MHVRFIDLQRGGGRLPERHDRCDVRGGHRRLLLRGVHFHVPESAVLLRNGSERGVLAHVLEQLFSRAEVVCFGQPGNVRAGKQRLLGVRDAGCMSRPPELHGERRFGLVHVQHKLDLPFGRVNVCGLLDRRRLHAGFERLFLPVHHVGVLWQHLAMPERSVRCL
jgi:hypothetical protein